MSDETDDHFGDDGDEFNRLTNSLFDYVNEFAEDEDIPDDVLSLLLLRLSLTLRMMSYATSVAKPSGAGLKKDLDRFLGEAESIIRAAKKDAEQFIETTKAEIAAAAAEENDGET